MTTMTTGGPPVEIEQRAPGPPSPRRRRARLQRSRATGRSRRRWRGTADARRARRRRACSRRRWPPSSAGAAYGRCSSRYARSKAAGPWGSDTSRADGRSWGLLCAHDRATRENLVMDDARGPVRNPHRAAHGSDAGSGDVCEEVALEPRRERAHPLASPLTTMPADSRVGERDVAAPPRRQRAERRRGCSAPPGSRDSSLQSETSPRRSRRKRTPSRLAARPRARCAPRSARPGAPPCECDAARPRGERRRRALRAGACAEAIAAPTCRARARCRRAPCPASVSAYVGAVVVRLPRDDAGIEELAQPRGEHRPRDAGDARRIVVEARAPAEELAHDEERPALARRSSARAKEQNWP